MASRDVRTSAGADVPVRIVLRPVASPLPIGLLALAVGSFVLSGQQLHWVSAAESKPVAICLLAFVVPLQFAGFVFAVLSRDEGAASALAVLAGTWAATALVTLTSRPGSTSGALGLLLASAAAALIVPAAVSVTSKPLVTAIIVLIAARFAITAGYELGASTAWQTVAGVLGLVVCGVAALAAAAFALEEVHQRPILPTLRRPGTAAPHAERSDTAALSAQHESGVRPRL